MAQKNKAHVKARTSKPAASKTAPRPAKTKTVIAKAGTKKPVAVSSSHARKPIAVKPAVAKVAKAPVAAKPAAKAPEVRKPAVVAIAAPAAVRPPQAKAAAPVRPGPVRPGHVPVTPARAAAALAKTAGGQKLTAPVQASTPKDIAEKTAAARQIMTAQNAHQSAQKKSVSQRHGFKTNEFIVYPAHGVGRIVGIEEQEIAGMSLELFVITFDKEKLTLRVPTGKLESVGMRKLADDGIVKKAMDTLKGRARVKRTMWSRRAQEYVAKINSGDLVSIAEVVRDLYRSEAQPEQSYSERQLYEDALDRMAREIAAVEKLDERGAVQRITDVLSKSARGRRIAEGTEPADARAA
jgi:CarD family transcriptional regulator